MNLRKITSAVAVGIMTVLAVPTVAFAAPTTETVLEGDVTRQVENTPPTDKWVLYSRPGTPATSAIFVTGPSNPPLGAGSMQLTTANGTEKAFLFNFDHLGTKLADINDISYETYRTSGSAQQIAALNLVIDFDGPTVGDGFSTLVFEPVYNTAQGPVVSGEWQDWIADGSGIWWATRAINGQCAGATDACDKTWAEIVANNPDATILGGVGVNQGSGNPGLVSSVDAFVFDETTYNFEPNIIVANKEACKNGGWEESNSPEFKNQGDCVSSFASKGKANGSLSVMESLTTNLRNFFN